MSPARVSVVMPVYNARAYLDAAVESMLKQTLTDFELVIVDDASTDGSWEKIQAWASRDPRVQACRNPENLRISRALNRGLALARGVYIARMDADDVAAADRLAKQAAYLDSHPEVVICGGSMWIMEASGRVIGQRTYHLEDAEIRRHLFRYSPFSHPTVMMRKSALDAVGYYDPAFDFAEDYELYFRLGRVGRFGNLPDFLLSYRLPARSITALRNKTMELKTLAIRRKAATAYGYRMRLSDIIYWIAQYASVYTMPYKWKVWLFNRLAAVRH